MTILKTGTGVEEATAHLLQAEAAFDGLAAKFAEITAALESGQWQGLSYKRCMDIHTMITEYNSLLTPFCGILGSHCAELGQAIRDFAGDSENIRKARKWKGMEMT